MIDWSLTWTMIAAIGTGTMAIAVIASAFYAFKNWNKSLKRDKQDTTIKLFSEFSSNSEIQTGLGFLSYSDTELGAYKSNAIELTLFFAKLGKLLKEEAISIEEISSYFYNYLFYEKRMLTLINNLKKVSQEIPEDYINNFNYLMNRISELFGIKSYHNLIVESFKPISFDDFGRSIGIKGKISDEA